MVTKVMEASKRPELYVQRAPKGRFNNCSGRKGGQRSFQLTGEFEKDHNDLHRIIAKVEHLKQRQ